MAGDWLKIESSTPEKPEVFAIATRLGTDPDRAFGICFRMWRWFDQHTADGNAPSVTPALLDWHLGVTGFAQAAIDAGWLILHENGLSLPNFDRHNGQTSKARALTYSRVRSHRASVKRSCNAPSVTESLPETETETEIEIPSSPPTPSVRKQTGDGDGGELENGWGPVVKHLKLIGLVDAATAVRAARDNGLDHAAVLAIAEHWSASGGAWEAGALHFRIRTGTPEQGPGDGWPPRNPTVAKRQKSVGQRDEARRRAMAFELVRKGRAAKRSDEEIKAELQAKGLEWP